MTKCRIQSRCETRDERHVAVVVIILFVYAHHYSRSNHTHSLFIIATTTITTFGLTPSVSSSTAPGELTPCVYYSSQNRVVLAGKVPSPVVISHQLNQRDIIIGHRSLILLYWIASKYSSTRTVLIGNQQHHVSVGDRTIR